MANKEREIISKSSVHKIFYPLYQRIQQINPLSKNSYEQLKFELEKSGEFNTRPEDIQIAQIANACIYPLFFLILSLFIAGNYKPFFISFGVLAGYYMYRAPIRNLKQKKAKFEENKIQDFTRFITIYLMQSSGNKTVYDALTDVNPSSFLLNPCFVANDLISLFHSTFQLNDLISICNQTRENRGK
ncbi:hypothetical protein [Brevibacillus laterosporus]|uniref:hypothetical protein n=1 Tax=Brevibacillus laterosporus TaxID=1465 RepID=UPI000839C967|nr:hypothetical protein [Brevibacillus laterosporus]